jgi:hypothetical protein
MGFYSARPTKVAERCITVFAAVQQLETVCLLLGMQGDILTNFERFA